MINYFKHEKAGVEDGSIIGDDTKIWAYTHILSGSIIGKNCNICDYVYVEKGANIGNNVVIKNGVSVWDKVIVGDNVFIGPNTVFTNDLNPRVEYKKDPSDFVRTVIKEGATLGANCTIVCGITIGKYAFIGAGAVVIKSVPDFCLVVGNPAETKGFVCKCGYKLSNALPEKKCENCNRKYSFSFTSGGLVEKK